MWIEARVSGYWAGIVSVGPGVAVAASGVEVATVVAAGTVAVVDAGV